MGLVLVVFGIVLAVVLGFGGLLLAVFGLLWARRAYSGPSEAANRSRS
jgi:hypothetical protein